MRELQLVGYTADLQNLVFCDAENTSVRYRTPVGEELVNTLREVFELTDPDSLRLAGLAPAPPAEPAAPSVPEPAPVPAADGPLAALALAGHGASADNGSQPPERRPRERSRLSPREIQALLRAGQAPRAVARQAGTDEAWVRRWLAPIEAEIQTVLQAVQQARVSKARLGPSRDLLGDAVRKNLTAKGIDPDDESVVWSAARREGEEAWTVTLRYRSRGRLQRARWRYEPESGTLDVRNALATDIAWTRPARTPKEPAAGKRSKAKAGGQRKQTTAKATRRATAKKAGARAAGVASGTSTGVQRAPAGGPEPTAPDAAPSQEAALAAAPGKTAPRKTTPRNTTPASADARKAASGKTARAAKSASPGARKAASGKTAKAAKSASPGARKAAAGPKTSPAAGGGKTASGSAKARKAAPASGGAKKTAAGAGPAKRTAAAAGARKTSAGRSGPTSPQQANGGTAAAADAGERGVKGSSGNR